MAQKFLESFEEIFKEFEYTNFELSNNNNFKYADNGSI